MTTGHSEYTATIREKSTFRRMIDHVPPNGKRHVYREELVVPFPEIRRQVEISYEQMQGGRVITIINNSTWPVFVNIYRDESLISDW